MYKIEKENLEALFRKIAESQDLILPIKKAGQTNFGLWNEGEEADLETLKTVKSGKDAFFPQSETLYTCVRDGKKLTVAGRAEKPSVRCIWHEGLRCKRGCSSG